MQELHLHGNSIGDEGVNALMSGLALHKGLHFALSIASFGQQTFSAIYLIRGILLGKLTLLDIGNNSISARGAFHVGGYIKKTKSLLWLNLYMNDIGDEVELSSC